MFKIVRQLTVLLLAAAAVISLTNAQKYGKKPPPSSSSSSSTTTCEKEVGIRLFLEEIQPVYFGPAGTWATNYYYFYSQTCTTILVSDCYCNGDILAIYDNGQLFGRTDEVNCAGPAAGSECGLYGTNANECLAGPFCRNNYEAEYMAPGYHNITIQTVATYYGGGTGYLVLIDRPCPE